MYSLVLMMALGNGAAAPGFSDVVDRPDSSSLADHGHRLYRGRRHGCHGCSSGCSGGCWGGGWGGCSGGHWGGCSGGHWGGGCSGGGHGCSGGGYGAYYSGGYYGSMSPYGGGAPTYYGGAMYYQGAPAAAGSYYNELSPMPSSGTRDDRRNDTRDRDGRGSSSTGPTTRPPDEQSRGPAPATIIVQLPADAKLTIEDEPTQMASSLRTFTSPPIEPGKDFHYTLKAELSREGRTLTTSQRVTVRAGEQSWVSLTFANQSVTQR